MAIAEINWRPNSRQLRQFGAASLVALPLIGWLTTGFGAVTLALAVAGAIVAAISWTFPPAARPLYVLATLVAWPIGLVVGELTMLIMYYGVLWPTSLAMRLFGRRPLDLDFDPGAETYWQEKPAPKDVRSYYRQS